MGNCASLFCCGDDTVAIGQYDAAEYDEWNRQTSRDSVFTHFIPNRKYISTSQLTDNNER